MARLELSPEEREMIETTIAALEPSRDSLMELDEMTLDEEERSFVEEHARRKIRSALEIGIMARTLAEQAIARDLCDDRGAEHFLRSKAWVHNFGVSETSDEYFYALSVRSGNRLTRALDALIEIAQDRVFGTVDEEFKRLFSADG